MKAAPNKQMQRTRKRGADLRRLGGSMALCSDRDVLVTWMKSVGATLAVVTMSFISAAEADSFVYPGEPNYEASVFSAPQGSFEIRGQIRHLQRRDCWVIQIDADSPYVEGASPLKELVGLPRELQREGARVVLTVHANVNGPCLGSIVLVVESAQEEE
jgi:hypothetical protein